MPVHAGARRDLGATRVCASGEALPVMTFTSAKCRSTLARQPSSVGALDHTRVVRSARLLVVPFLLIRHGSVDYDAHPTRFRGHGVDLVPLTRAGIDQAKEFAATMATPDLIVSSPTTRTLQTAHILSQPATTEVVVEVDLHEWVPDRTQQWSGPDVPIAAYAELRRNNGEWPEGERRNWEPLSEVRRRAAGVLERYDRPGLVAVVCHSVVIEALTGHTETAPCGAVDYELPGAS